MSALTLPLGFPTHSVDITGRTIGLGDVVDYDFEGDDPCPFTVVFEHNAFRKSFPKWKLGQVKPLLEFGEDARTMRLKVITPVGGS